MYSEAKMLAYSRWHELLTASENLMGAEDRYGKLLRGINRGLFYPASQRLCHKKNEWTTLAKFGCNLHSHFMKLRVHNCFFL